MDYKGAETGSSVADGFERLVRGLDASHLISEPIEIGDRLVFTAVAVERAGGFGFGSGGDEQGGGGGGGGTAEGRPIAVISVGPDGVNVQPIVDLTRLGVTVLLAMISLLRYRRRT